MKAKVVPYEGRGIYDHLKVIYGKTVIILEKVGHFYKVEHQGTIYYVPQIEVVRE